MRTEQLSNDVKARSVLVHARSGSPSPDRASVVFLHGRYADHTQMEGLAGALSVDRNCLRLRAPRTQTRGHDVVGYYWYVGEPCNPEPSTFGDALQQVERFLLDREEDSDGFILVGRNEGAVLALVLAGVWPELVRGVAAIDPCLVDVPEEWELPQHGLDDMSALMTLSAAAKPSAGERLVQTRARLAARGARVEIVEGGLDRDLVSWLDRVGGEQRM